MTIENKRYERLRKLSPLKAIQAWMDGDFSINEEKALLDAVRTGTNTKLSDNEVADLIWESIDFEDDAQTCLSKIRARKRDCFESKLVDSSL